MLDTAAHICNAMHVPIARWMLHRTLKKLMGRQLALRQTAKDPVSVSPLFTANSTVRTDVNTHHVFSGDDTGLCALLFAPRLPTWLSLL